MALQSEIVSLGASPTRQIHCWPLIVQPWSWIQHVPTLMLAEAIVAAGPSARMKYAPGETLWMPRNTDSGWTVSVTPEKAPFVSVTTAVEVSLPSRTRLPLTSNQTFTVIVAANPVPSTVTI
jgi:hypothetical protein